LQCDPDDRVIVGDPPIATGLRIRDAIMQDREHEVVLDRACLEERTGVLEHITGVSGLVHCDRHPPMVTATVGPPHAHFTNWEAVHSGHFEIKGFVPALLISDAIPG
jgi:hypothetical protein